MFYHSIILLVLLHTFCLSSPIPPVAEIDDHSRAIQSHERLNYYELLCALYNDCEQVEINDVIANKFKPKRLTSNLFHGIPKFGKRAFVSAFSGIPKFG